MSAFGDLPLVVLDKIFSFFDNETITNASNVCLSWRQFIHKKTTPSNCDSDLVDKLAKCGWTMSDDHDIEKCKCIELNLRLLKFVTNQPPGFIFNESNKVASCFNETRDDEGRPLMFETYDYALTKTKICILKDNNSVVVSHLMKDKSEIISLDLHLEDPKREDFEMLISIYAYGNLVAVLEEHRYTHDLYPHAGDPNIQRLDKDIIQLDNLKKLHLFHLETLEHVTTLNITEQVKLDYINGAAERELLINIVDIGLTEDKLHVFLFCECRIDHSQIWKIDTLDPSAGNISHCTTVKHDEDNVNGRMHMNSRFFCVAFQDYSSSEAKLHIFNFDDLSEPSTKVIGKSTPSECYWEIFDFLMEDGMSNKIAVFDKRSKILNVFQLDDIEAQGIQVDLTGSDIKMSNFLMGKIMLIKGDFGNRKSLEAELSQFLIVTEDGDVIEGNKFGTVPVSLLVNFDRFHHVDFGVFVRVFLFFNLMDVHKFI